jgi:hypothetical protein
MGGRPLVTMADCFNPETGYACFGLVIIITNECKVF